MLKIGEFSRWSRASETVSIQDCHIVTRHSYSEREVRMNTNQNNIGRGFYLQRVLASAMGFGVGAILGMLASIALLPRDTSPVVFAASFGVLFGAVGGLAQWLVLRRKIPEVGLWVPASALGFMVAMGIAESGKQGTSNPNAFASLFAAIFGVTSGLLQWLNLRKQGVTVGWWLAANLLGSLLGIVLSIPALTAMQTWGSGARFIMILLGFGAPFGLGLSVITGGALVWLLRRPKSGPRAEVATQGTR
jgi:hypothetical protein